MLNKNLMILLTVTLMSTINVSAKNILSIYDSHKKIYTSKTLNPCYVGPLFTTGGAMTEVNRYISEMAPEKIGKFMSNSLTLIETDTLLNQVYSFNKVIAYEVTKDTSKFNVMYMESTMNEEKYDIVVEIKEGSKYDRIITIYKNFKSTILILWLDNSKIIQKKAPNTI
jgi:hypothetical protein